MKNLELEKIGFLIRLLWAGLLKLKIFFKTRSPKFKTGPQNGDRYGNKCNLENFENINKILNKILLNLSRKLFVHEQS